MNKLIKQIIYFSLRHRYLVFFMTGILAVIGYICYRDTPIETFPDVTNTQIIIITQAGQECRGSGEICDHTIGNCT